MFLFCIIMLFPIGVSWYLMSQTESEISKRIPDESKKHFEQIENGMSLCKVNSLLGGKGCLIKAEQGISIYKWYFDKMGVIGGYSKNRKTFGAIPTSIIYRNKPFVEIGVENGKVCNKKSVGLI